MARHDGLAFRQAHGIVSALVSHAQQHHLAPGDLNADMLRQVAKSAFGLDVRLSDEWLKQALDPIAFVEARDLLGGAAPKATSKTLALQRSRIKDDCLWLTAARDKLADADRGLTAAIADILAMTPNADS